MMAVAAPGSRLGQGEREEDAARQVRARRSRKYWRAKPTTKRGF